MDYQIKIIKSMDYQIKKIREVLEGCSNMVYEIDTKTFWAKDQSKMFQTWLKNYREEAITHIEEKTAGMELVLTTECNWFDEGGTSQSLLFANKKARERVWDKVYTRPDSSIGYFIQAEFMVDLQRFPEDYILFYNAAV
jgi:hypothetical protein